MKRSSLLMAAAFTVTALLAACEDNTTQHLAVKCDSAQLAAVSVQTDACERAGWLKSSCYRGAVIAHCSVKTACADSK